MRIACFDSKAKSSANKLAVIVATVFLFPIYQSKLRRAYHVSFRERKDSLSSFERLHYCSQKYSMLFLLLLSFPFQFQFSFLIPLLFLSWIRWLRLVGTIHSDKEVNKERIRSIYQLDCVRSTSEENWLNGTRNRCCIHRIK